MSLWALVPVKPLRRGKSRLAGVLSDEERTFINYTMLRSTLNALKHTQEIAHILVVSRDPGALAIARDFDAKTLQENSNSDSLNSALKRATVVAQLYAAEQVLVVPADLPLLDSTALRSLVSLSKDPPVVVIAPDRRKDGTNALIVNPAGLIEYQYGPGSFYRHMEQAKKYQVHVEIYEDPIFELDLDTPEDLEILKHMDGLKSLEQTAVLTGGKLLKL